MTTPSYSTGGRPADSSAALLGYLTRARTARVDRAGRKMLARRLGIGDLQLALAALDLRRRGLVTITGDLVKIVARRTAAPR